MTDLPLPPKPAAIAQISDALWRTALVQAGRQMNGLVCDYETLCENVQISKVIDHARCLILLQEVGANGDPLDKAINAAFNTYDNGLENGGANRAEIFAKAIRSHLGPFLKEYAHA